MRILITGGSGYLGSRVVKELSKRGHTPVLLVREETNIEILRKELENLETYEITNNLDIDNSMKTDIDCVLHLATLYGRNGEKNQKVIDANIVFPLKVIESAIQNHVKYFFNIDTAIHKLINAYTITKKHFRDWGKYYGDQEKIRFINMKTEHFYGPYDSNIKFVANIINQLKNNKECIEVTMRRAKKIFYIYR